jgi:hypothetical protein
MRVDDNAGEQSIFFYFRYSVNGAPETGAQHEEAHTASAGVTKDNVIRSFHNGHWRKGRIVCKGEELDTLPKPFLAHLLVSQKPSRSARMCIKL